MELDIVLCDPTIYNINFCGWCVDSSLMNCTNCDVHLSVIWVNLTVLVTLLNNKITRGKQTGEPLVGPNIAWDHFMKISGHYEHFCQVPHGYTPILTLGPTPRGGSITLVNISINTKLNEYVWHWQNLWSCQDGK